MYNFDNIYCRIAWSILALKQTKKKKKKKKKNKRKMFVIWNYSSMELKWVFCKF